MDSAPIIAFELSGEPVPKGRPRRGANGNMYTPPETRAAEEMLRWHLKLRGARKPDAESKFRVDLVFRVGSKRGRRDIDNLAKLVLDACNGLVWKDDSQVETLFVHLLRRCDNPGTRICLFKVEP